MLYESVILNQKIDYFVLESEYKLSQMGTSDDKDSKKKFNLKKLIVEKFKKIIEFLKFIKNKVVEFIKKTIPILNTAIKRYIGKIKSASLFSINKKYNTIDINQIVTNIDTLMHDFKYFDYRLSDKVPLDLIVLKKLYTKNEDPIEESDVFIRLKSQIKDLEDKYNNKSYEDLRDEYCNGYVDLSKIGNITIGYKDIFSTYYRNSSSGSELQLLIQCIDKYIEFNEKVVTAAENIEMKTPENDTIYLGLVNRLSHVSTNIIKSFNQYVQDTMKNIKAFNQYFNKYLVKEDVEDAIDHRNTIDKENKDTINRSKYTDKKDK